MPDMSTRSYSSRLCSAGDEVANLFGRERAFEGAEEFFVALLYLHLERLIEKAAMLEVVDDDVEQVEVEDFQVLVMGLEATHHPLDVVADFELIAGGIVKEVAGDFVADALAREEPLARDLREYLVEAACQG